MTKEEIQIAGKKFVSLKRVSEVSGYAKDYIGQLCRNNKINSKRIGRDWFVDIDDILSYKKKANKIKRENGLRTAGKLIKEDKGISLSWLPDFVPALGLVILVLGLFVFSSDIKNAYRNVFYQVASATHKLVSGLENGAEVVSSFTEHSFSLIEKETEKLTSLSLTIPQISIPEIKIPKPDLSFVRHSVANSMAGAGDAAISFFSFFNSGMETVGNLVKDVAEAWTMSPQNLRELAQELFGQETLIVAIQTPSAAPISDVAKPASDVVVIQNPITKTVVEKTIERVISGLTSEELDAKLNQLNSQILNQISGLKNELVSQISANQNSIALTNRINNLGNVTISNPTFSGTVAGLTDADIPDSITASNYLPLSGGTLTGALDIGGNTDITGDLAVGGNTIVINGQINVGDKVITQGDIGIGTSTPMAKLTIQATDTATTSMVIWGIASQTLPHLRIFNNSGTEQFTFTADAKLGIGTSTPFSKLSVAGRGWFDDYVTSSYFTATSTTATSTFPYLTISNNSNLGTVVGGTWQGSEISDAYISDTITASNYLSLTNWFATTTHALISSLPSLSITESQISDLNHFDGSDFWTYFNATNTDALTQGSTNLYNQTHSGEVTGATVLTIASNVVDEDNLKMSTSPTDNFLLIASSSASGGMDWVATSSPLLNFAAGGGGGTVTSIDVSGGTTGLTFSGGPITTSGTITMAGTLGVAYGGTGSTTLSGILKGNGTGIIATAISGTDYVTPSVATLSSLASVGTITTGVWNAGALTSSGAITGTNLIINSTSATSTFSTGGLTVGTSQFVVQQTSGNVGIGTTSPAQLLSVAGHCVTGDSELITASGEKLRVDSVKPGDMVLSLNEATGKLVPSRINALLDMGIKPIYKIETEDGKTIRTTAEHPYLVLSKAKDLVKSLRPDSSSLWFNDEKFPSQFAFFSNLEKFNRSSKNSRPAHSFNINNDNTAGTSDVKTSNIAKVAIKSEQDQSIFEGKIKNFFVRSFLQPSFQESDDLNAVFSQGLDQTWRNTVVSQNPHDKLFNQFLNHHYFSWLSGQFGSEFKGNKNIPFSNFRVFLGNFINRPASPEQVENVFNRNSSASDAGLAESNFGVNSDSSHNQFNDNKDKNDLSSAEWTKVIYLHEGDEIAVADDNLQGIKFVRIAKIEIIPPEQVYDLSIEGTHNFVANGIIAHNTYITGGFGAGLAETTSGNITGTGRLSIQSTSATSTFSTGGLTVGTSQFVVQQTSGNVGIGTTTPGTLLSLGNTGANTINISTTATSTFGSGINIKTGCFAINGSCIAGAGGGTVTSVDVSGGSTGLTFSGGPITTSGTITAAGTLAVGYGGTGLTSYTLGDVIYANTTSSLTGTSTANLKTTLKLNLVENTALTTWAGTASITTLGTIGTGVWNGTPISAVYGGTGLSTGGLKTSYIPFGNGTSAFATSTGLYFTTARNELTITNASTTLLSVSGITYLGTGTTTASNGFAITAGCFAINGTCVGGSPVGSGTTGQFPYYAASGTTLTATSSIFLATNQRVGIGTTTPWGSLALEIAPSGYTFVVADTGTSTPMLYVDSGGITYIENLQTGPMSFSADSGAVTWMDMPVTTASASSTLLSYTAKIDATSILTVSALSNGAGGVNSWAVGIGTSTPMSPATYGLLLSGKTAYCDQASCWVSASSRSLKTHITELTDENIQEVLQQIASTSVYFYNMNYDPNGRIYLGVIAEEAPDWITSPDKMGISGEAFANFLMAGMKGMMNEISDLSAQLADLKSQISNQITITGEEVAGAVIRAKEFIVDKLIAKKVVTDALEMKDSLTGEVYCVRISGGEWDKFKGTCGEVSESSQLPVDSSQTPSPTPTPDIGSDQTASSTLPTPLESSSPSPSPTLTPTPSPTPAATSTPSTATSTKII